MDSRPHDDFLPPERSVLDDASPATEALPAAEEVLSPASTGHGDLYDAIDDLELELASLLTPDLEAMDIDAPAAAGQTQDAPGEPAAALAAADAAAADRHGIVFAAQPETADAAEEADALIDAVELELALDEMAADMLAAETPAEDDRASGETVVPVQAETAGATQVAALVEPAGDETAAGDAMADPAPDAPTAVEPSEVGPSEVGASEVGAFEVGASAVGASAVEPAGPSPIAQTGDQFVGMTAEPVAAEHAAMVEAFASTPEDAAAEASASAGPEAQPIAEASPAETPVAASPAQAPAEQGQVLQDAGTGGKAEAAEDAVAARDGEDIVAAGAIMVPQQAAFGDAPAAAASFEEALGAQDLLATGFEAAVRSAAAQSEGRFLFQMPVHTVHDCQRVAAVNLAGDAAPTTVLVLLRADGRSFRMEDARGSDNPFAGMAVSYGGLLAHLKSLPSRAAA